MNKYYLILGFLALVGSIGCEDPIEGCLDPEAINYELIADEACSDDCCTYPTMNISIFHQYRDTALFIGDTLINNLGQEYSIIAYVYFLSDWQFKTSDQVWHSIEDSISLDVAEGTILEKDDIIRVKRTSFTYDLGQIVYDGTTEEIQFQFGISENFNNLEFSEAVSGHPLTNDPDSLSTDDGYVMMRVQIAQGAELQDTVIYDISDNSNLTPFVFEIDFESLRGTDKKIEIQALYNQWFDNVDFEIMSKEGIETQLALEMQSLFTSN